MDNESKRLTQFLDMLANAERRLRDSAIAICSQPEVAGTTTKLEFWKHSSSNELLGDNSENHRGCVQGGIYADLRNGKSLAFSLGIYWSDDEWQVESFIGLNEGQDYSTFKHFPLRKATTLNAFMEEFQLALDDMEASLDLVQSM